MELPKISVITPTFKRAKVIANAIRSIIDQTFKDWEFIIVDDGSEDGTKRIVNSFAHPKIKYFELPHSGHITKLRNFGAQKAQGELIVVQDSDDISFPNRLEEIWKKYKKTNADLLYHGMYLVFYDQYHNCTTRGTRPAKPFSKEELLKWQFIPGQCAYKRKCILETPYDENIIIADDYMMLLDFMFRGYKFQPINLYLYDYMASDDSINIIADADGRRRKDIDYMVKKLKDKYNFEAKAIYTSTVSDIGKII